MLTKLVLVLEKVSKFLLSFISHIFYSLYLGKKINDKPFFTLNLSRKAKKHS